MKISELILKNAHRKQITCELIQYGEKEIEGCCALGAIGISTGIYPEAKAACYNPAFEYVRCLRSSNALLAHLPNKIKDALRHSCPNGLKQALIERAIYKLNCPRPPKITNIAEAIICMNDHLDIPLKDIAKLLQEHGL